MPRKKYHRDRLFHPLDEPGPGSIAVGYVRYSSEMQDPATIVTQKRVINEFAAKKGWKIARWYEEPEQSAKYEDVEERPVFAQLLKEAEAKQFQVVLCYANNRWARNTTLTLVSLSRLRRANVWWATADGVWDLGKIQQDGLGMGFLIDTQMNEMYIRQLSKRTIDGKEDRARDGYHNGKVSFGYLPPEYPKAPDGAPSTWRPPRMPARTDPETFPALVRIGELAAQGWSDSAIADELKDYISRTPRFGERFLTKDTIAAIRRSWFPREFAPGCGHGTIETPQGDLVEGRHQAAWPYELWQRMIEAKAAQYRRPTKEVKRHPHEFSRIIVCAACRRPLRVMLPGGVPYYKDTSTIRKLECSAFGSLSIKSATVIYQFGELLSAVELPSSWREAISERCNTIADKDGANDVLLARRSKLEAEQKRLVSVYTKGYMSEEDFESEMGRIRAELFELPVPIVQDVEELKQAALSAGETLLDMASYWSEAAIEERRDIVWALLEVGGLVYDLERRGIVGLIPRSSMLPVLTLGLERTERWEQRGSGLWLRTGFLPEKQVRENVHVPPPQEEVLTPEQQEEALRLMKQGQSLRQVARHFGVSRGAIHRLAKKVGMELRPDVLKLNAEQQLDALEMLDQGMSLRQVARHFGVNHESLRRLVKRLRSELG